MPTMDFLIAGFEERYGFSPEKAREYMRAAAKIITERGFVIHDLPPRKTEGSSENFRTGYFKGKDLYLDPSLPSHIGLAALTHVAGHAIQWACPGDLPFINGEEAEEIGNKFWIGASDEELVKVTEYEEEASRIGLDLLHDAGVTDTDEFISDYFHADNAFLMHYYRTKEVRPLASFWPKPVLEPLDIDPKLIRHDEAASAPSAPVLANLG